MTALPAPVAPAATRVRVSAPPVGTILLCTAAFTLSLLPTLLPRPALVQALLSGLLLAVAVGVAQPVERLARRLRPGVAGVPVRWSVLASAAATSLGALIVSDAWLAQARQSVGLPPVADHYWPLALLGATLTSAALVAMGRGVRRVLRLRTATARAGFAMCVLLPVVTGAVGTGPLVSAVPFPGDDELALTRPSPAGGVRVYVGVDERRSPKARADLAVRRMERRGAFERAQVVVAFPTGTGWVNPEAVAGFERALHGDVATVAVQAGKAPSWMEMFLNRPAQEASAQALLAAVSDRIAAMPERDRPDLHLYGESLGALLGQTAMAEEGVADRVCSVLWAGVPGGGEVGGPRERVLRNADDPVPLWAPETAVRRPDTWPTGTPWVPGLSYVTTSLDLVVSLGSEPGHGHVYGPEQSWHLPRCPD